MKKYLLLIAASVALIFSGCTTSLKRAKKIPITHPDVPFVIKNYELGKEITKNIGDIIISGQRAYKDTSTIWRAVNDFQAPEYGLDVNVDYGQRGQWITTVQEYKSTGETAPTEKGKAFIIFQYYNKSYREASGEESYLSSVGININEDGSINMGHMGRRYFDYNSNYLFKFRQGEWPEGQLFKKDKSSLIELSDFKFTITYLGKENDIIRLKYMEYINDMARPAFSSDITWDLKESDIANYKTIKVKVISATNSQIKLIVTEDDDLSWLPE